LSGTGFEQIQTEKLIPRFLSGVRGLAYQTVSGLFKNVPLVASKNAVEAKLPLECPPDALPYCARDRDLDIGYIEGTSQKRNRLAKAWPTWTGQGNIPGLKFVFDLGGFSNIQVLENTSLPECEWFQFEVWIIFPLPFIDNYLDDGYWGDYGDWGDGGIWPEEFPALYLELTRALIKKFKPTHTRCRQIVLVHGGDFWDENGIDLWDAAAVDLYAESVTRYAA
jgi:hypothetical protein